MNARELAAYRAGICHAADAAIGAAAVMEQREGANDLRQRTAIEALRAFAEGLKAQIGPSDGMAAIVARIAQDPAAEGTETCPRCAGRVRWIKDASNGHIHARCEAAGCFTVMQ